MREQQGGQARMGALRWCSARAARRVRDAQASDVPQAAASFETAIAWSLAGRGGHRPPALPSSQNHLLRHCRPHWRPAAPPSKQHDSRCRPPPLRARQRLTAPTSKELSVLPPRRCRWRAWLRPPLPPPAKGGLHLNHRREFLAEEMPAKKTLLRSPPPPHQAPASPPEVPRAKGQHYHRRGSNSGPLACEASALSA
eukprot:IDg19031t1